MKTSVAFAVDAEWGTTHVVCEEHATHAGARAEDFGGGR